MPPSKLRLESGTSLTKQMPTKNQYKKPKQNGRQN